MRHGQGACSRDVVSLGAGGECVLCAGFSQQAEEGEGEGVGIEAIHVLGGGGVQINQLIGRVASAASAPLLLHLPPPPRMLTAGRLLLLSLAQAAAGCWLLAAGGCCTLGT